MIRVGQGIDVHAFDDSRPLILGGVRISDTGGLAGHSDADAVLHAVTDALLGAAGAGDIGHYFPSSDPRWKDADSAIFLREAKRIVVAEMEAEIANLDITIIAERPKLALHRDAISAKVAKLLDLPAEEFRRVVPGFYLRILAPGVALDRRCCSPSMRAVAWDEPSRISSSSG